MNTSFRIALLCLTASLSACNSSTVKDTLGLDRTPPDEFRVVARPPLSVPPEFSLRPPSTTSEAPTATPADKKAKSLILGKPADTAQTNTFTLKEGSADTAVAPVTTKAVSKPGTNDAESAFLERAGADKADPTVRKKLTEEKMTQQEQQEEAEWWDIFHNAPTKKDPMVDAKKESERIKDNKSAGKPVNEGDTPEVGGRDTGVLGRILGY